MRRLHGLFINSQQTIVGKSRTQSLSPYDILQRQNRMPPAEIRTLQGNKTAAKHRAGLILTLRCGLLIYIFVVLLVMDIIPP